MEPEQDEQRRTWVFQANPARYPIEDSLRSEQGELWNLMQHAREVRAGDRVLVWISGPDAGIYAIGTVQTDPVDAPDSTEGQAYWTDEREGLRPRPRVLVTYERLLDRPLLKCYLEWDADLDGLAILRQPRGTNFRVTEAEWAAIRSWLEGERTARV